MKIDAKMRILGFGNFFYFISKNTPVSNLSMKTLFFQPQFWNHFVPTCIYGYKIHRSGRKTSIAKMSRFVNDLPSQGFVHFSDNNDTKWSTFKCRSSGVQSASYLQYNFLIPVITFRLTVSRRRPPCWTQAQTSATCSTWWTDPVSPTTQDSQRRRMTPSARSTPPGIAMSTRSKMLFYISFE